MEQHAELESRNSENLSDERTVLLSITPPYLATGRGVYLLQRFVGVSYVLGTVLASVLFDVDVPSLVGASIGATLSCIADPELLQLLRSQSDGDELYDEGEEEGDETEQESVREAAPDIRDAASFADGVALRECFGSGWCQ